jgi:RimJ/RimL family protein N-acetyltransferase
MSDLPTIQTGRLKIRPFTLDDVATVSRLAGERDIASTTILIPHPYAQVDAENWIKTHEAAFAAAHSMDLAVCDRAAGQVLGAIGLVFQPQHDRAELGYWIGKPYWGRGYATEAGSAVLAYAFTTLRYHRVGAYHFTRNPASGRVLQKIGMRHEGVWRGHMKKWGVYEDCEVYGILRAEWESKAVS